MGHLYQLFPGQETHLGRRGGKTVRGPHICHGWLRVQQEMCIMRRWTLPGALCLSVCSHCPHKCSERWLCWLEDGGKVGRGQWLAQSHRAVWMDRKDSHLHLPGCKQPQGVPGMVAQADTEEDVTERPCVQEELRPCSKTHEVKWDKKKKKNTI